MADAESQGQLRRSRSRQSGRLDIVKSLLADEFDVQRKLGRGAMATVYLADRLSDGKQVAIKVLHPEFALSVGEQRFHREIKFLEVLQHPNILPLLQSGATQGLLFYVMPYAPDGSLGMLLREITQIPLEDALGIAKQIADALDHAHQKNIVHRDIKPGNILFDGPKSMLCDFGVARAIVEAGADHFSSSGLVVGTPYYMSPEQARGSHKVDGRSDVYAFACLVYEMLMGEPPFTGRTAQAIMARHVGERPPSLRVILPELPEKVEIAVHKALAKDPHDRFGSAHEFISQLN